MSVSEVRLPKMGMSTVEVDIIELNVEVGSRVVAGTPLLEVEGEKSSFTVEASGPGTVIEILAEEGDTRNVGDIVLRIEDGESG